VSRHRRPVRVRRPAARPAAHRGHRAGGRGRLRGGQPGRGRLLHLPRPPHPLRGSAPGAVMGGGAELALPRRRASRLWDTLRARPGLLAGGVIVGGVILLALLAPWLVRFPHSEFHVLDRLSGPSAAYWFGT